MKAPAPRMFTYATAIATLIVESADAPNKLATAKIEALRKIYSFAEWYASDHFDTKIIDTIVEKKMQMVLGATTIQNVREIAEPPRPHFDGAKWHVSKNSVPEEEMIWWSKTSLLSPLAPEAFERYMELFKGFYGKSIDEMIDGNSGGVV